MDDFLIRSYAYNEASVALRKDIAELLNAVWPNTEETSCGENEAAASHRPEQLAQSFCCYANDKLVGYAAVVFMEIIHGGRAFKAAGLSCVATLAEYRGCGIASKLVSAATQYMAVQTELDFGVFTCHGELAALYEKAGGWRVSPSAELIGSRDAGALSSASLQVVVLMRLFSQKARLHKELFCKEPIYLGFPVGEFL
ncbi:MAG: GNAT family N-acetyltransferase [Clostridia bacterium]